MRKIVKNASYMALVFLWPSLMLSCIKEAGTLDEYAGNTTDVLLTVSRGTGSGSATDSKEGIKQMRVIVAAVAVDNTGTESETLLQNNLFSDESNTNAQTYTVNMDNLPKGLTKFYVVCNEESLPEETRKYLNGLTTEGTSLKGLATYVVNDPNRTSFPKMRLEVQDAVGIPITGISETIDLQKKDEVISFGIQYMVARLTVNVTNKTTSSIELTGFKMSAFFSDQAYLFPQAEAVVPPGTTYALRPDGSGIFTINKHSISQNVTSNSVMNLYVYPSEAQDYTAGLRLSTGKIYDQIPFFREGSLNRGVWITLSGIFGTKPTPEFSYTINWNGEVNNDVPAFD